MDMEMGWKMENGNGNGDGNGRGPRNMANFSPLLLFYCPNLNGNGRGLFK